MGRSPVAALRDGSAVLETAPIGGNPGGLACADLDGDGRSEVLVALGGADALVVLRRP
ncbi:MAG: hypothetical protein L0227_07730 [Chloroflexi bacterium]|nr:hypothetical protein [Chloroflexota bacterium]